MEDCAFEHFYHEEYSKICTILKRVNYINSAIINLPVFEISPQIRKKVEEQFMNIQRQKGSISNGLT